MSKKIISSGLFAFLLMLAIQPSSQAAGGREAVSSLILPTTGQAMNGELATRKTQIMAGVEAAAITTVAVLGIATGGGIVWLGLAPLIGNHIYSAADAYKGAKNKQNSYTQQQMLEAQRTIDLSREKRFDREQGYRSDLRERVRQAGETASY